MPAINPQTGRLLAKRRNLYQIALTGSGRAWHGHGSFAGVRVDAQTTAGTGIKVYDGWDNTGVLLFTIAAPAVGPSWFKPTRRRPLRNGLFVELLGTGQTVTVMVG